MSTEGGYNLTQRDLRMMSIALTCMKGELVLDADKFQAATGLKNAASARAAWHAIKKKLEKGAADGKGLRASLIQSEGDRC